MNIIKLYGGLGNQLFQYAFGKAMQAKGVLVRYDNSTYVMPHTVDRLYLLDKFNTNVTFGKIQRGKIINEVSTGYEKNMEYLSMDNVSFVGYWQHPSYFMQVLPKLKQEFRVRKELYTREFTELRQQVICNESTSIHVRRGDYVQINGHYLLDKAYYEAALKLVPESNVYVFSDDIPWCKENFKGKYTFIDLPDYLSFDLMRVCKHNIIANSTFSWWAAYLNTNPGKVVITPKRWRKDLRDPAMCDPNFMNPQGWTIIDSPGIIT